MCARTRRASLAKSSKWRRNLSPTSAFGRRYRDPGAPAVRSSAKLERRTLRPDVQRLLQRTADSAQRPLIIEPAPEGDAVRDAVRGPGDHGPAEHVIRAGGLDVEEPGAQR